MNTPLVLFLVKGIGAGQSSALPGYEVAPSGVQDPLMRTGSVQNIFHPGGNAIADFTGVAALG
ncbi:MAG: hypothetical protein KDI63_05555 [Gammaproteobacteria bacterium]|nr:hypothetical protein [Gammaproteobacteria bacterium]